MKFDSLKPKENLTSIKTGNQSRMFSIYLLMEYSQVSIQSISLVDLKMLSSLSCTGLFWAAKNFDMCIQSS